MTALNHAQLRQRYLDLLPDSWFGAGKLAGGDTYQLADAIVTILNDANQQVAGVQTGTYLADATGAELDQHGQDYGVPRVANELDATYLPRIQYQISAPKNTISAIVEAVKKGTGLDCRVYEPLNEMLTIGRSKLGRSKLQGAYYSHGVFDVQVIGLNDALTAIVESCRPSGYHPFYTSIIRGGGVDAGPTALGGATIHIDNQALILEDNALRLGRDALGISRVSGGSFFYPTDIHIDVSGLYTGMATVASTSDGAVIVSTVTDYMSWPPFRFGDPGAPVGYTVFGA